MTKLHFFPVNEVFFDSNGKFVDNSDDANYDLEYEEEDEQEYEEEIECYSFASVDLC